MGSFSIIILQTVRGVIVLDLLDRTDSIYDGSLGTVLLIVYIVGLVIVFRKIGRYGWEAVIPFYGSYILYEAVYGNGWKFLLRYIPIIGIYFIIKVNIDLAREFGQSAWFGVGLFLLPYIFYPLLAFGNYNYMFSEI